LYCWANKISDLEPLCQLTSLRILECNDNKIRDLEPLRQLTSLEILDLSNTQISQVEIDQFKKAVPNCGVCI